MFDHSLRVAVIGAGPAGIAVGHELLQQGFDNITLFEKSDAVGGTWHLHTYPGLACDLWAHSYTFASRPNPDWSASFVEQPEIEQYLQRSCTDFGLDPYVKLNTKITNAEFSSNGTWLLTSEAQETFTFDVVINAMGNQHTAAYPNVEGMDSFNGDSWHGTRWNHDVDLQNKRVAIIGSAASAIQVVPELAKQVGYLTVLQRTPNWIMARGRKFYSKKLITMLNLIPGLVNIYRRVQSYMMSFTVEGVTLGHKRMDQFETIAKDYLHEVIKDPVMRKTLTPNSRYGCKRGLVSDDFYPALLRDNVELVAEGLKTVRPEGITTACGKEIDVDVIIYCTGYRILDYDRINVIGLEGKSLAAQMAQSPTAYMGIAAVDFPNYFFAAGPNGLAINASYFVNVERNAKTIVRLLKQKQQAGINALMVKQTVSDTYNQALALQFSRFSWGASNCNSYYRTATGHAPFLFPGSFKEYNALHNQCSLNSFEAV
tara:strand:- start:1588 stop:3042 length:1455 start_codon:yes stop_codon:yes gene_type:complete